MNRRFLLGLIALLIVLLAALSFFHSHKPFPTAAVRPGLSLFSTAASGHASRHGFFVNETAMAGVNYRWTVTDKRPLTILGTIGNGCAFLDYDNDGNLDILLIGTPLALYKGDGRGHFVDVTHTTGLDTLHGRFLGCAVGDYDNDDFDDIYISGYETGVLLHNERGRSFRNVTQGMGLTPQPWGTCCAFGDVNGDGFLDLYVGNYVQFSLDTAPQLCAVGSLGNLAACGPGTYKAIKGIFYFNEGGHAFRAATAAWDMDKTSGKALGAAFADYDDSGRESLEIANDGLSGDLLHNTGNGFENLGIPSGTAFTNRGGGRSGMGVDWGDYDNDGKLDLLLAAFENGAKSIYHNEGASLFEDRAALLRFAEPTVPYLTFGAKWVDYDNDGWLDILLTNGHVEDNIEQLEMKEHLPHTYTYKQQSLLFHNEKGQWFTNESDAAGADFATPIVGRGLAVGDYDNDGKMDALFVDSEGTPLLLHNQFMGNGHWLGFRLVGTKSNHDGYGALVTVVTKGLRQVRRCGTDGSYLSASDKRVHIGLGSALPIKVTIRWPSGHTHAYPRLSADRYVTLREDDRQ